VDELVMDRILDEAAAARGLSREALLREEVDQKVAVPEAAEVEAFYQQNKDRIGPHAKADVLPRIVAAMVDDRRADRARAFMQELRGQAKVRVLLEQPRSAVNIPAGAAVLGPEKAPVTIVEFSDYLCPYCQRAEVTVTQVLDKYKGKVRFVHQDFLLGRPRSLAVARSAHCAGEQGKFWEYRDDLLRRPGDWSDADLVKRTSVLGLDAASFRTCLASDRHDKAIHAASESGQELGVQSTPTFFVNGKRLTGARGIEEFEQLIDGELAGS
jgi:protein-disulfide isomerase